MTQLSDTSRPYPDTCKAGHDLHDDIVYFPKGKGAKWRCRLCLRAAYAKHYKLKRDAKVAEGWIPNKNRNMPPPSTECRNGHAWNEENTYTSPRTNHRQCRPCRRARLRRRKEAAVSSASST